MQRLEIENLVQESLEGAVCTANDLTGTSDHWGLSIEWAGFDGLSLLEQHRTVLEVLRPHMDEGSGEIHAVQIKTSTK